MAFEDYGKTKREQEASVSTPAYWIWLKNQLKVKRFISDESYLHSSNYEDKVNGLLLGAFHLYLSKIANDQEIASESNDNLVASHYFEYEGEYFKITTSELADVRVSRCVQIPSEYIKLGLKTQENEDKLMLYLIVNESLAESFSFSQVSSSILLAAALTVSNEKFMLWTNHGKHLNIQTANPETLKNLESQGFYVVSDFYKDNLPIVASLGIHKKSEILELLKKYKLN